MALKNPILSIDRVSKWFGGLVAVSDLSVDIMEGEAHGLMGPNGAGKTTLISVISGSTSPTVERSCFKDVIFQAFRPIAFAVLASPEPIRFPNPLPI